MNESEPSTKPDPGAAPVLYGEEPSYGQAVSYGTPPEAPTPKDDKEGD